MIPDQPPSGFSFGRFIQKSFVSTFVVVTFLAYVAHERLAAPARDVAAADPKPQAGELPQPAVTTVAAAAPATSVPDTATPALAAPADTPVPAPTDTPAAVLGAYKDGQYTGPEIDAFYGLVKVQATVQDGKISDVEFLEYPNDRRTSIRINNVAVPYLKMEALQAQSANVDLISGATLTSQAFVMSLQQALSTAKR